MPPRHVYWTIIFGNQPTAFRAATREELLPTLKQLRARHPDAVMMWFARGRLWQSEEEAREALIRQRQERARPRSPRFPHSDHSRPPGAARPAGGRPDDSRGFTPDVKDRWRNRPPGAAGGSGGRGRDWRPGGDHKDPRDRFKVPRYVKRARFKAKLQRDRTDPRSPQPGNSDRPRFPPRPPKPRSEGGRRDDQRGPRKKRDDE